jgi:hypothetical protein
MVTQRRVKPNAAPKAEIVKCSYTSAAFKCYTCSDQTASSPQLSPGDDKSLLKSKPSQAREEQEAKKSPQYLGVFEQIPCHGCLIIGESSLGQVI